jgi:hypothetical protein
MRNSRLRAWRVRSNDLDHRRLSRDRSLCSPRFQRFGWRVGEVAVTGLVCPLIVGCLDHSRYAARVGAAFGTDKISAVSLDPTLDSEI